MLVIHNMLIKKIVSKKSQTCERTDKLLSPNLSQYGVLIYLFILSKQLYKRKLRSF